MSICFIYLQRFFFSPTNSSTNLKDLIIIQKQMILRIYHTSHIIDMTWNESPSFYPSISIIFVSLVCRSTPVFVNRNISEGPLSSSPPSSLSSSYTVLAFGFGLILSNKLPILSCLLLLLLSLSIDYYLLEVIIITIFNVIVICHCNYCLWYILMSSTLSVACVHSELGPTWMQIVCIHMTFMTCVTVVGFFVFVFVL